MNWMLRNQSNPANPIPTAVMATNADNVLDSPFFSILWQTGSIKKAVNTPKTMGTNKLFAQTKNNNSAAVKSR
jgi:hypothetical protein